MSQEITDAMLQARAIASASERYDKIMERDLWLAWKESHLAALEVERACYYTLKEALSIAMRDASEHEDPSLYVMQLRAIIDRLRTRLGINLE